MGRILAIDYGTKRVGLAVTDAQRIIATALDTIHPKDLIAYLEKYISENEVDIIVVGEPKRWSGEQDKFGVIIDQFSVHLSRKFPNLKIERHDEQFTSKLASQSMHLMGATRKQKMEKGNVDKIAATIILQSYMSHL